MYIGRQDVYTSDVDMLIAAQVIRLILIAVVVSSCILDELGQITHYNTAEVSTVAGIMIEVIMLLGGYSWVTTPYFFA